MKYLLSLLVAVALCGFMRADDATIYSTSPYFVGQTAAVQAVGYDWDRPFTKLESSELKGGKLIQQWVKETPSNIVPSNPPQYSGPTIERWRDIYAASNGVVILERSIRPTSVTVSVTNISNSIELQWSE